MTQSAPALSGPVPSRDESWVFFDGEIRRYADSRLGLMTHALHYGTGCFEGIRAYWVEEDQQLYAFRMAEHYERLRDSSKILLMELPYTTEELCAVTTEILSRNGWRQDVYIRPLVYKSSEEIGVRLHGLKDGFLLFSAPFGAYVDIDAGIRCMVSSWRRIDDNAAPARSKCTGIYVNSALAKTEAMQNGFDEAIMLTHEGHVSEGSAENIFLVRNGTLITPPESDNILEGITRSTLIHLATEEMGLEVVQRCIDRSELYVADEVFLCGTGAQVSPVIEIDRRRIGDGEPGPLTTRIQADYFAICKGRNPKYRDWLPAVY
ncbi:MAG TPA: branched-chain amino acid transaminase [Candidatus Dormibacteraeota bacterium]|nr:branched-chain amino acid transaminase [Candidatus Dormibacteraeota bacterium]